MTTPQPAHSRKENRLSPETLMPNEVEREEISGTLRARGIKGAKPDETALELLAAAKLVKAFLDDLAKSNPGFMGRLVVQDYAQWNEAMIQLPRAIAKAERAWK